MNTPSDSRPIGVFDSGIGGLTVLRSLIPQLPLESFIYLGDTARLPYGSKSQDTIARYLEQNVRFLSGRGVKAVVVACNSASTVLLEPERKNQLERLNSAHPDLPIYNVIEPGARAACLQSTTKKIGVLGTKATIAARAYVHAVMSIEPSAEVFQQACPLLVPLVEEGWENDPLTNLILYRYISQILGKGIDTLIMGCTHYPALKPGIQKVAGPGISLIDSAATIAQQIQSDIETGRLGASTESRPLELLITDVSPSFREVAERLMSPLKLPALKSVDIQMAEST